MNKKKYTRAPEVLWVVVASISIVAAIHKTIYFGFSKSILFYGFVFVSIAMYLIRRRVRKNIEKE